MRYIAIIVEEHISKVIINVIVNLVTYTTNEKDD